MLCCLAAPTLIIASGNEVCLQLRDLIKWGPNYLKWIRLRSVASELSAESKGNEPVAEPLWDPAQIVLFASSVEVCAFEH